LLLTSTAMIAPAAAQNAAQQAAKDLLQAADKAIGASNVHSYVSSSTGWMGSPGQQFAQGDLPRGDLKSYTRTVDYGSKSGNRIMCAFRGTILPAAAAEFRSKASSTSCSLSTATAPGI
jgi:hypothetical protein